MTGHAAVVRGDAAHLPLPDGSADLIVCSPPFWALRSYTDGGAHYEGQIGSEATPREYLDALQECTREWMRVLKPAGSIFVELGDKYNAYNGNRGEGTLQRNEIRQQVAHDNGLDVKGIQAKSLLGLPWRYALGCVDQLGLILRRDIIWHHVNGLPESVTDRCRSAHSYVFHFTKQPRYYSAVDEVREAHTRANDPRWLRATRPVNGDRNDGGMAAWRDGREPNPLGKLPGSVWSIPSAPLTVPEHLGVDHFAAYPPELVRRIIAGWSPREVCTACGEGRRPVAVADPASMPQWALSQRQGRSWHGDGANPTRALGVPAADRSRRITGYACACPDTTAPATPGLVVDPFAGTGTTMLVASAYGRIGIGTDRSADYCRLARWRCSDPGELARVLHVAKPPVQADGQGALFSRQEALFDGQPGD